MSAIAARSSNSQQSGYNHNQSDLYMKIVCDPGHERTTRELRELPRESRERVWADMGGASAATGPAKPTAPQQQAPSPVATLMTIVAR